MRDDWRFSLFVGYILMKTATLTFAALLLALPALAQTPVAASSLASPEPMATTTPTPSIAAIIVASVNGGAYRAGDFAVHVGDVMTFNLLNPTADFAANNPTLAVKVNGKDLQFPSSTPLAFIADKAGIWTISLDMPGYESNQITVTAQ